MSLKKNAKERMHLFGVIFDTKVKVKYLLALILSVCIHNPASVMAGVYGGGFWEAMGLGNMQCKVYNAHIKADTAYKELGAVWLSGFLSGINFTSTDIYDITQGEDIYSLTENLIKQCEKEPDKLISDFASEMVYKRYKEKKFTKSSDKETKQ